jgi:hypothetical protein
MPRPKKRARHLKNAANLRWNNQLNEGTSMSSCDINENGRSQMIDTGNISDQSSQYEGSTDEETEDILEYNVFDPIEKEYNLTDLIKWHTNADEWLPLERGTSIRTIQRANKFQNDLKNEAKTMKTLDNYFVGREFKESRKFVAGFEKVQFEIVLEHLSSRLEKLNNKRESQKEFKNMDLADISRLMAVLSYFRLLKTGMFKMEASRIVAQQMGRGPNRSNVIRQWAAFYFENLQLPYIHQGKHVKTKSLISDEDVKLKCIQYLKSLKPKDRTITTFASFIHEILFPVVTGAMRSKALSKSTIYRWLHTCGFHHRHSKKGNYVDGHEREDVKVHRTEFIVKIMNSINRTEQFLDNDLKPLPPVLGPSDKKLILVWHDESCFSANDGINCFWLEDGEKVLKKKGNGKSLMVSGFLCQCHGLFSSKTIVPGTNDDGWWTCEDLIEQVKDCLKIFKDLHPFCDGLFIFDNSMNHKKKPDDGLYAEGLPLKDGGRNVPLNIRDGWYFKNEVLVKQKMHTSDGISKGLLSILQERCLIPNTSKLRRLCKKGECDVVSPFNCCAVNMLRNQPDFQEQKLLLEE